MQSGFSIGLNLKDGGTLELSLLSVPLICEPLSCQPITYVRENLDYVSSLYRHYRPLL